MKCDFSDWSEYAGATEGSGRSEKLWIRKGTETGLFKYKKDSYTTDHVSEKLASEIAGLLNIPCAKIELGIYNGREGSLSYLINMKYQELIEGINFINNKYPNYSAEKMQDAVTSEFYSIEMIMESIKGYHVTEEMIHMLIFDFLIGNSDRHQNNWALIKDTKRGEFHFSPLYDNSSSLCCYLTEEKVSSYLGNDKLLFMSLIDSKSKSIIRIDKTLKKQPTHYQMLKYLHQAYHKYTSCFLDTVLEKINRQSIENIITKYADDYLSEQRKKLIVRFLIEKTKLIRLMLKEE